MGKKRKSIATSLDEVDRTMYSSFCIAANSLSQLYTQGMNQQKLSFQAGERHGMEKLYQWIRRQQEGGSRVTTLDILSFLQNELDYSGEEPAMSPRPPVQQHSQPAVQFTPSFMVSSGPSGQIAGQGARPEHSDQQPKNTVFSNALSSPIRRSLQNYHISQGGGYYPNGSLPSGTGARSNESNDSSMDMHSDSPAHDSTY